MNEFRFIKYEDTPKEKHLGIITVLVRGIVLRYKIVTTKDGSAKFPAPASYKVSGSGEEDRYIHAFGLDSNSEQELLYDFIKHKIVEMDTSKTHQGVPRIADLKKTDSHVTLAPKIQPIRSNEEFDTSDDLPF